MMTVTTPRPGSGACREGPDVCAVLLTLTSILIIVITIPLSLLWSIKVVQVGLQPLVCIVTTGGQEYERAVIFRLGRLLTGGARGPGTCSHCKDGPGHCAA